MDKLLKIKTRIGNIAGNYIDCGDNKPLVIIAHGRGGNRNTGSKKIAEYLQSFGISSLRIDLYGYGESDGKFENITITTAKNSVLGTLDYVQKNIKHSKLFLFGTSYGGSGILGALSEISPSTISGLIFRCTILNYLAKTHREMSEQQISDWKNNGNIDDYEGKLNYSFYDDQNNYKSVDYEKLKLFNSLYFYAGKDSKILLSEVDELRSKLSDKLELVTYPNSVHGIDIQEDFDDMMVKTKDFVQQIASNTL